MSLPPVDTLPKLPTQDITNTLDLLFEPSTQLHTLCVDLLRSTPFPSYDDLVATVGVRLTDLAQSASTSDTEWLHAILGSHPRLGAKNVESAQSQAEQAQLQANAATGPEADAEAERLATLNAQYEAAFPGLRFVTFVDGRPRPVIMDEMTARIKRNDMRLEEAAAIKAMCDIAADRARKLSP